MNDNAWYTYVAAAIALVLVIGLGVGLGLASTGSSQRTTAPVSAAAGVDYVNLTIAWNPATGLDEYFPANFTVPAHTLVEITITSYDNGTNVISAPYNTVRGTTGGSEWITRNGVAQKVEGLPTNAIAHTFTMMAMGSMMHGGGPVLNAVVPPAASPSAPIAVTFGTYFNSTGTFVWNCMAPCDMGAMAMLGLMAGSVSVV